MIYIDLEVYSEVDIKSAPLDVYANHPSTRIILACIARDEEEVGVFTSEADILSLCRKELDEDSHSSFNAWNVSFERTLLKARGVDISLRHWTDTMVEARYVGLPGGLKNCAKLEFLGLPQDHITKSETALIKKFCTPLGKGANGETHPEEWAAFVDYCRRDVESTRAIHKWLKSRFPFPEKERKVWILDQEINERGLPIDVGMAAHGMTEADRLKDGALGRMKKLTGLDNPNSVMQLLPWLKEQGYTFDSLGKNFVQAALAKGHRLTPQGKAVLELRLDAAKSSVKKFSALVDGTSPDGRIRQQFKYYGAHTGRWSGRGAQPQNLPRTECTEEALADMIRRGDIATLEALSTTIRSTIRASKGYKLVFADLSAIENRVLGWLSGCDTMLDIYSQGRDPYIDFATRLYGISYDEVTKVQRQVCKPPVLGCGYGLGPGQERHLVNGETIYTGLRGYAANMGVELTADQAKEAVQIFRREFVEVTDYWSYLQDAFYHACRSSRRQQVGEIFFHYSHGAMVITLPSGRNIHYLNAKGWSGSMGKELRFEGLRGGFWGTVSTWGGSLTENVVQAVARDVLVEGMLQATKSGMKVVGHCHDEIICEVPVSCDGAVQELERCMTEGIGWAKGLPLAAKGEEGERYKK